VIDVNSGNRSKSGNDQETNALEVNLAAANEIARQLRLRDIGGIIVVDFIDMHSQEHRQQLFERMKEVMSKDRTKHNILPLSKFGLLQITRQRVRPEMNIETLEKCPTCKGTGQITSSILLVDEIANNLDYFITKESLSAITLRVHPYIEAYLRAGFPSTRMKWQFKYKVWIKLEANASYGFLEYHFMNKIGEEILA
jgi:ribonuclease G